MRCLRSLLAVLPVAAAVVVAGCSRAPVNVDAGFGDPPPPPAGPSQPHVPDVALPDTAPPDAGVSQPPAAWVSGADGEIRAQDGSVCWTSGLRGYCADSVGPGPDTPVLQVGRGETVTIRFARDGVPGEVGATLGMGPDDWNSRDLALAVSNPTSFVTEVEPGTYYLFLRTSWPEGDPTYFVRLVVV